MIDTTLYSIGHGSKSLDLFLEELKEFKIDYVVDVRSKPYSKFSSHFNQNELKYFLKKNGIFYLFLGDLLGGIPDDPSCRDEEGRVDYQLLREKSYFQKGIQRLVKAHKKHVRVAVMCSETRPEECHRYKLIGRELLKYDINMKHIISKNNKKQVKTQMELNRELWGLFGPLADSDDFLTKSRKSYL